MDRHLVAVALNVIATNLRLPRTKARRVVSVALVAVLTAFLVGCDSAAPPTPTTAPPAEPPAEPPPTLLGTWETVYYGHDDEGAVDEKETTTLTFTETHFFERNHVQDADGRTRHKYDRAGTLSHTGNSVTKTFVDDDGTISVEKEYVLAGDGDVLLIHHWGDDGPADTFDRFIRVAAAPTAPAQPSTLRGTWQRYGAWEDDEDGWVEEVRTVTFTGTRFITHTMRISTDNRELVRTESGQGGWTDNGSSVTKRVFEDDQERSVEKQYVLAGDLLAINPWWADDPLDELDVFIRVPDPLPGGVLGSWTCQDTWTRDGEEFHASWIFTFGESSFTDDFRMSHPRTETFNLTGDARYDEDGFVFVTGQQATQTIDGSADENFDSAQYEGHVLRYAYAPTGKPDEIVLSPNGSELMYDRVSSTWTENEGHPYGDYNFRLGRQVNETTECFS